MTNQKELQRETELLAVLVPIERIIAHEIALIASRNSSIRMLVRQYSPKRWFVRCCILWGYGVLSGFFTAWQLGDALETEQIDRPPEHMHRAGHLPETVPRRADSAAGPGGPDKADASAS